MAGIEGFKRREIALNGTRFWYDQLRGPETSVLEEVCGGAYSRLFTDLRPDMAKAISDKAFTAALNEISEAVAKAIVLARACYSTNKEIAEQNEHLCEGASGEDKLPGEDKLLSDETKPAKLN